MKSNHVIHRGLSHAGVWMVLLCLWGGRPAWGQWNTTNLGKPLLSGSAVATSNGFDVTGAGADLGGNGDQCFFTYEGQQRLGDFDVQVRVQSLAGADVWAKAGLMARELLTTNSRYAAVLTTPNMSGLYFHVRTNVSQSGSGQGSVPATYPNTWLRLKRAGKVFTGYASADGNLWMTLGSISYSYSNAVYLGFVVSSHQTNQTAVAQFRDYGANTGGTIGNYTLPTEPLGPCSRKTGLVISEILYNPPGVPGYSNSTEFLEIFNSNPFFEELSGYRISGAIDYAFPTNTILASGAFLVLARNPGVVQSRYGLANVLGPWAGAETNGLPDNAGTLRLRNNADAIALEINYSDSKPWPEGADGTGHSIVLARPSYGENDPRAWALSDSVGGSPGRLESSSGGPLRQVMINEFLAHSDAATLDFIELYNHSAQPVDISGCSLSDSPSVNKFIVPTNTVLPPRGLIAFDQATLGFGLSSGGETLYLRSPDGAHMLDAVRYEAQALGRSSGRLPEGGEEWYPLQSPTPGAANSGIFMHEIVINEIMYAPLSNDADDEYVELYNQGANAVNLGGWRFVAGINYTFPSNTVLAPDSYLVVAKNVARLLSNCTNLTAANTLGNFGGTLANRGERLALGRPDWSITTNALGLVQTNLVFVVVDEVTYGCGGRWGQWAHRGGSSLELVDPRANHRLPPNWADSDETHKAPWTNIEWTGVLDNGVGGVNADSIHVMLLGEGEFLLDDVEVIPKGSTNKVRNGSFETGTTSWVFEGNHEFCSLETTEGYTGTRSLHVAASGRGDTGANKIRSSIITAPAANSTATLRAKARWLRGFPEMLLRLHGNWLEAPGTMAVPANLGTPGARNSRAVPNAPPAIYAVTHNPILPAASQPVVVTARAQDPDGLASLKLYYRVDPATTYTTLALADEGAGGDAVAHDGVFSATIPGQTSGKLVAFYLQATDNFAPSATSLFPAQAPMRECLIRFGEPQPMGNLPTYRLWVTSSNVSRWTTRSPLNNALLPTTFVYGNRRVCYDMGSSYKGSPFIGAGYNGPTGTGCGYSLVFNDDDLFLGTDGFSLDFLPRDSSCIREQVICWLIGQLGAPFNRRNSINVYFNGTWRSIVYEDAQKPDEDFVESWYPNHAEGDLYKLDDGFEFYDDGSYRSFARDNGDPATTVENFTTTGGVKKTARYRWHFRKRAVQSGANDYHNVFNLVDAANLSEVNACTARMNALVDIDEWMRVFIGERIAGNWDSYGFRRGKNMYAYKPDNGTWKLLIWDIDFFDSTSWPPSEVADPVLVAKFWTNPSFLRNYYRVMREAVNGPLQDTRKNPVVDAHMAGILANGIPASNDAATIKTWLAGTRTTLQTTLSRMNTNFTVAGANPLTIASNWIALTGIAPLEVTALTINGQSYPVTWTSVSNWMIRLILQPGANQLVVKGYDRLNTLVANAVKTNTITFNGLAPDPAGLVVFNEIMYHPAVTNAEFVELFNNSPSGFDLSGWRVNGLGYTFPQGTVLAGRQFLALAQNQSAFVGTYSNAPFAEYQGRLDPLGETLTLYRPGANSQEIVVSQVRYENQLPWITSADGRGPSLELIDPDQDITRPSNWGDGVGWRFFATNASTSVQVITNVFVYLDGAGDVYIDDLSVATTNGPDAGVNLLSNGDFEAPLEGAWNLGTNCAATALSADIKHAGSSSLHLVFTKLGAVNPNQSVWQPITLASNVYRLSFWYLPTTNANKLTVRFNTYLQASVTVKPPAPYTPGRTNLTLGDLPAYDPVWLNEVQGPSGAFSGWVELFNSGTNALNLEGYYLADNYTTNLLEWAFPAGAVLGAGEHKLVWADGGASTATDWHARLSLGATDGTVALVRLVGGAPQITDYLTYTNLALGASYGDFPEGQCVSRRVLFYPSPGAVNTAPSVDVCLNEWMASNRGTRENPDDPGHFDDWFELYNRGSTVADLSGYFFANNLTNRTQSRIPNGTALAPGAYLLVWADGQNTGTRTNLHANFKLSAAGEAIALFGPGGELVDGVSFGPQTNDISQGRWPNGQPGTNYVYFTNATPGWANLMEGGTENHAPVVSPVSDQYIVLGQSWSLALAASDPDAGQQLSWSLAQPGPAGLVLEGASGRLNWTPGGAQAPGTNRLSVIVSDNGAPPLSSAASFTVYVVLPPRAGIGVASGKVTLSFPSVAGKRYQVLYKDSLGDAVWQPWAAVQTATGPQLTISGALGAAGQRFFRIQVVE